MSQYLKVNGLHREVEIVERYHQEDIFGQSIEMVRVRAKNQKTVFEVEADKLLAEKPKSPRKPKINYA